MGHTNSTVNYNLPQFVGTDKPSWLGDVNGAFLAIDTAIAAAKTEADSAAGGVAGLQVTVGSHTTQIGTLTDTVTAQGGTLNSVTALIGNGTPTTTDQTIIGAINELNAKNTYQQMALNAATTYSDIVSLITASIAAGKIPHIKCEYTASANIFHDVIVKYVYKGYDSNDIIVFSSPSANPEVLYSIVVRTTGTESPHTNHSVSSMVLYY